MLATFTLSAWDAAPFVAKACRLKALIRQAFFNYASHATASRPSPTELLQPAVLNQVKMLPRFDHAQGEIDLSKRYVIPSLREIDFG
jgi:phosphatidylserine/phosphatidylglycerophosphate/cardiolipin synthase-like enzyme